MTIYFGENVKRLRKEKNLTQETLAEFLGVSFQAVSKWERGESLPDITYLPAIASFFGVTTDMLLGADKTEQEEKIQRYIDGYLADYRSGDYDKMLQNMKAAVTEFPGEFRLYVRYMEAIIMKVPSTEEGILRSYSKVQPIYENIQNYCTIDSIRMWAKRLMCTLYKRLSFFPNSGIELEDMEKVLEEMPVMSNSKDFIATYLYPPGEKHDEVCRNAIEELIYLLNCAVCNHCYYLEEYSTEYKINAVKAVLSTTQTFYPEGDYGRCYPHVVYNYGHLGQWYFDIGDTKAALKNLRESVTIAKRFDDLPEISAHISPILKGLELNKSNVHRNSMCERMKYLLLKRYSFPEEFKNSEEFRNIIEMLN